jgi:hypothetical protein
MLVAPAWGAEDPGARVLQQQLLLRQQQQEALQLRMQQQNLLAQPAPADARQRLLLEPLQAGERQRLDQAHYRQAIAPATAQPSDDEATRRAKAEMERLKARQ